eukprot:1148864-Prorocentrum_minimum.AAC.1
MHNECALLRVMTGWSVGQLVSWLHLGRFAEYGLNGAGRCVGAAGAGSAAPEHPQERAYQRPRHLREGASS